MRQDNTNWRSLIGAVDGPAEELLTQYITHLMQPDVIPAKYRELIIFAASTALKYRSSMQSHAKSALAEGATTEELTRTVLLCGLSAGFTSVIEGMSVLNEEGVLPTALVSPTTPRDGETMR